jgi:hypothetical protein
VFYLVEKLSKPKVHVAAAGTPLPSENAGGGDD